jgi:trk system potassium uptake protein TrkH
VDGRSVARAIGTLVRWFSLTLIIPAGVALGYGEPTLPFILPLVGGTALGLALERLRGSARVVGVREGFAVVALGWLVVAGIASVPYILVGGDAGRPVDAFFEGMSGITATGSSVLVDIPGHDRALLFWRALTQWIGGMGIVVLAIAILPGLSVGGRGLAERETSGHDYQKLLPRARDSAARLWLLYVALSVAAFVAFGLLGLTGIEPRMGTYDAITTAMTTVAAGGFSAEARSFEAFGVAAQWVAIVFMTLVGVSFVLWYRALFRSRRALLRDEELRLYATLLGVGGALLAIVLYAEGRYDTGDSIRHGLFQSASAITGTGFASVDFAGWSSVALAVLLVLMFAGGCAGSVAGGLKIARVLLVGRMVSREVRLTVHRQQQVPVRLSGRTVSEPVLRAIVVYVVLYLGLFALGSIALAADAALRGTPVGLDEAISASAATLGNVGPAFGAAGPMGSFAGYGDPGKVIMALLMWAGRLELLPVIVILSRAYWRR